MAHSHDHLRELHPGRKRAHEMSKHFKRGGKVHSDEKEDRALFSKLMKAHEAKEMKVEGKKSGGRLDKYARGGRAKGKHGNKTNINIVVAPHGRHPAESAAPPALGGLPPPGAGPLPPRSLGGPPMGMPMGGPPGLPPGGPPPMKRGGAVKKYARGGATTPAKISKGMTAGAETGKGRLQKARISRKGG